jgi:hypothetical protein
VSRAGSRPAARRGQDVQEDADLRAALVLAILFGVSAGRNLIELGPLRDASPEQITELLRPCFEVLTGALRRRALARRIRVRLTKTRLP